MAGQSAYNDGLIGQPGPAGTDSYNTGKIGSEGAAGPDAYNYGLVGSGGPAGVDGYNYGLVGQQGPAGVDGYHYGKIGSEGPAGVDGYHYGLVGQQGPAGVDGYNYGLVGQNLPPHGVDSYNHGLVGSQRSAGVDAYNRGRAGSKGPAGVDAYNRGLVGSTDTAGVDGYNYGLVGSQPDYPDPYNRKLVGDKGPIGSPSYNYGLRGGGGLPAVGSKPAALHTEYAEGESASPIAYGTQDIVFYLQRAGGEGGEDGPEEGGQSVPGDLYNDSNGAGGDVLGGADSGYEVNGPLTGGSVPDAGSPDSPYSGGQTSGGQIAAKSVTPPIFPNQGALLGTLTGHFETKDLEVGLGETTQNAGFLDNRDRLLLNAIGSVPNLERDLVLAGTGASEKMFAGMYNKAFNPDENLDGPRTPEQIRKSLSRASSAELSVQLAKATGGVRRVRDLTALINNGDVGLTSQKTRAIQSRLSRHGSVRRRK